MRYPLITLLLLLSIIPDRIAAQNITDDFLPLAVGNQWIYEYLNEYSDLMSDYTDTYVGSAHYSIISKSEMNDSCIWTFEEIRNLIHSRHHYFGGNDASYSTIDTNEFDLIEYLSGDHKLVTRSTTFSSVFHFPEGHTDTAIFYRYYHSQALDTIFIVYAGFSPSSYEYEKDSLGIIYQRLQGIKRVSYNNRVEMGSVHITDYVLESAIITAVDDKMKKDISVRFMLDQNYPNPFNPVTTIKFSIPVGTSQQVGTVSLRVYDLLGREVITLVNENFPPGTHTRQWDASGFPSGVYFYRLSANGYSETKKLVLMK